MQRLRNLGPKSTRMLHSVGIETVEDLQALGSIAAYLRVKSQYPSASLNLLWAIEGALSDSDWKAVASNERMRLLMALDDYKNRVQHD